MAGPDVRYAVDVESSDDPDVDAELVQFEDDPRTLEETAALCRRLGLRARLFDHETGERLEVAPDGNWRPRSS